MNQNKTYRVNDIFYTLQGEGFFTGVASVFIRLADCNLNCSFCDTEFSSSMEMGLDDISETIGQYKAKHIVLTGGEPTLQADKDLIDMLHEEGCFVQIETNGTNPLPEGIDWITYSPKQFWLPETEPAITECDELKVVYTGQDLTPYENIQATHRFLQPCDTGDATRNREIIERTVQTCLDNPQWRLSLQTHKVLQIR